MIVIEKMPRKKATKNAMKKNVKLPLRKYFELSLVVVEVVVVDVVVVVVVVVVLLDKNKQRRNS